MKTFRKLDKLKNVEKTGFLEPAFKQNTNDDDEDTENINLKHFLADTFKINEIKY